MTDDASPVICAPAIPASVAKKVHAVMAGLKGVAMTGQNRAQNYTYTEARELLAAIREQCIKHGLLIIPSVAGDVQREKSPSGKMFVVTLPLAFDIVDPKTGEYFTRRWIGEGADMGDKAINKAMTAGMKTFLLNLFLVPQFDKGDSRLQVDPESDETTDKEFDSQGGAGGDEATTETKEKLPADLLERAMFWVNANPELKDCCKEAKVKVSELRAAADCATDADDFRGRLADLIATRGGD